MSKNYYLIGLVFLLFISGCGDPEPEKEVKKEKKQRVSGFKTNTSSFITTLDKDSPSRENRNDFMDEFVMKSDMQCQQYLNRQLTKSSAKEETNNGLYMNMFDATSQVLGVKTFTDGAKTLYMSGSENQKKELKLAYEKALSPEIKRGVEIAREEFARTKMYANKYKLIESYTNEMLERDMKIYDKLCSHEVGLIEINKALKKMQKQPKKPTPFSPKVVIDPVTIQNKVEAVNEKMEATRGSETTTSGEPQDQNTTAE